MAAAGRGVAKVLGIKLDYRKEPEVSGAASVSSVETCKHCQLISQNAANEVQTSSVSRQPKNTSLISSLLEVLSSAT